MTVTEVVNKLNERGGYWVGEKQYKVSPSQVMAALRKSGFQMIRQNPSKIKRIKSKARHFGSVAKRAGLTARERNVVAYAIEGLTNNEIGRKLGISGVTVGIYLTRVYAKTGVGSRQELAWYMQRGKKTTKKIIKKGKSGKRHTVTACKCGKSLSSTWKYCPMCGKKTK